MARAIVSGDAMITIGAGCVLLIIGLVLGFLMGALLMACCCVSSRAVRPGESVDGLNFNDRLWWQG